VAGMTTLVACDKLSNSAFDIIEFIDSMDKLFDIFNSHPISCQISDDKKMVLNIFVSHLQIQMFKKVF